MSGEEEQIFYENEMRERAWREANAKLVRERTARQLQQATDRDQNGSTVFGLPQAPWTLIGSGPNRSPTLPRGDYVDDSRFNGHEASIYEPNWATRLWYETLARAQRSDNRNLPQQYSTSQLGETFSQMPINEQRRPRVYGARW